MFLLPCKSCNCYIPTFRLIKVQKKKKSFCPLNRIHSPPSPLNKADCSVASCLLAYIVLRDQDWSSTNTQSKIKFCLSVVCSLLHETGKPGLVKLNVCACKSRSSAVGLVLDKRTSEHLSPGAGLQCKFGNEIQVYSRPS